MEEEKKEFGMSVPISQIKDRPDVIIVGAGAGKTEELIRVLEESDKKVLIVDDINEIGLEREKLDLDKLVMPVYNYLSCIPFESICDSSVPNKLKLLRDLKLSPEQIDYFKNAPPQRLEGEKQEDYKTRRMLNKLIIKYRGEF